MRNSVSSGKFPAFDQVVLPAPLSGRSNRLHPCAVDSWVTVDERFSEMVPEPEARSITIQ